MSTWSPADDEGVIPIEEMAPMKRSDTATWNDEFRASIRRVFNLLSGEIHRDQEAKGFYNGASKFDNNVIGTKIALIHSEASELLEAYRREPMGMCDKKGSDLTCEEEELADILIRTLDLAAFRRVDIGSAIVKKIQYDRTRPYKHGKRF